MRTIVKVLRFFVCLSLNVISKQAKYEQSFEIFSAILLLRLEHATKLVNEMFATVTNAMLTTFWRSQSTTEIAYKVVLFDFVADLFIVTVQILWRSVKNNGSESYLPAKLTFSYCTPWHQCFTQNNNGKIGFRNTLWHNRISLLMYCIHFKCTLLNNRGKVCLHWMIICSQTIPAIRWLIPNDSRKAIRRGKSKYNARRSRHRRGIQQGLVIRVRTHEREKVRDNRFCGHDQDNGWDGTRFRIFLGSMFDSQISTASCVINILPL